MKVTYNQDTGGYDVRTETGKLLIYLQADDAVQLVRDLYSLGLEFDMPTADNYLQGKLEATEKHLEDMRKLVMEGVTNNA